MDASIEWAGWAMDEISRLGELPAWLEAAAGVAQAVEDFDGSDDALTDVWAHVEFAVSKGLVTPPREFP